MKTTRVRALGQDRSWLAAILEIADPSLAVETVFCRDDIDCFAKALPVIEGMLLLLDVTGRSDAGALVRALRAAGWCYVVAVTAAPSAADAREVLKAGAWDYWPQSYDDERIRQDLLECVRWMENK